MRIEETFVVQCPIERTFAEFNGIERVGSCIAGVKEVTVINQDESEWLIEIRAGFMARTFRLHGTIEERRPPTYLAFKGVASDVTITGQLVLEALGTAETRCTTTIDAKMTGALAPLVDVVARGPQKQMVAATVHAMRARLEGAGEGERRADDLLMNRRDETPVLLSSTHNAMRRLTLNRPEQRNALNEQLIDALFTALQAADQETDVAVVVLNGSGKGFCAGADLKMFGEYDGVAEFRRLSRKIFQLFGAIEQCSKPVIVAAHGFALAGGFELCLAADLVVAAESTTFGTPEARVGLTPAYADIRLAQVVGLHNAKYLALVGDSIDAAEAHRIGLVNIVCGDADLNSTVQDLASRLASNAPIANAAGKALLNGDIASEYQHAVETVTLLQLTEDRVEGVEAFKARRDPDFQGR